VSQKITPLLSSVAFSKHCSILVIFDGNIPEIFWLEAVISFQHHVTDILQVATQVLLVSK